MLVFLYFIAIAVVIYFGRGTILTNPPLAIGLFFAALFGYVIVFELNGIPKRKRAKKAMAHLTGVANGRVKSHYEDTYEAYDSDRGTYETRSRGTVVSYEFEVNGVTYTGSSYGSWSRKYREYQPVLYDPQNPSDNCTQAYYNSKTKSHYIGSVLYMAIGLAALFAFFKLLAWLMGAR